jgi:hypothetical protein
VCPLGIVRRAARSASERLGTHRAHRRLALEEMTPAAFQASHG